MAGGWFKTYAPNTPVRLIANVEESNRIRNILNDIQGIGCRIEKPRGANGLGWRIVVGSGTDVDPIPDSDIGNDTGDVPVKPYDLNNAIGVPTGGCIWWPYDPAVKPIPPGWVEATEMRGKYPVGYLASDTDFDDYGATVGSKTHEHHENLDHTHTIPPNVFPSPVDPGDVKSPGQEGYNPCLTYLAPGLKIGEECGLTDTERSNSMTWCAGADSDGNFVFAPQKHIPPSFVGLWIKKL